MTRLAAPWNLPPGIERAWPEELRPEDPFSGDEGLPDPATYAQYLKWVRPALLSEEAFQAADAAFLAAYFDVLAGRSPWGATDAAAAQLAIDAPLRHDRRPARPAMDCIPDDVICDLAEDWVPSLGLLAPPRVVGPWSMLELPRRVRVFCGATMSFAPLFPPSIRPMSRPGRSKPKLDGAIKSALIAVLRAPMMVWTPGPESSLTPLLPLARRSRPEGPVAAVPTHADGQPVPAVVGRAVRYPGGWWLACALPLPAVPDAETLLRRFTLEHHRLRRHDRRMSWEDTLRDRGELVARTVCEWLWVNAPDEVESLWNDWSAGWSAQPRVVAPRGGAARAGRKGPNK